MLFRAQPSACNLPRHVARSCEVLKRTLKRLVQKRPVVGSCTNVESGTMLLWSLPSHQHGSVLRRHAVGAPTYLTLPNGRCTGLLSYTTRHSYRIAELPWCKMAFGYPEWSTNNAIAKCPKLHSTSIDVASRMSSVSIWHRDTCNQHPESEAKSRALVPAANKQKHDSSTV